MFMGFTLQKQIQSQVKEMSGSKKKTQQLYKSAGNKIKKKYIIQKYFNNRESYYKSSFCLEMWTLLNIFANTRWEFKNFI